MTADDLLTQVGVHEAMEALHADPEPERWDSGPTPLSARWTRPAFPVDVLPGWLADQVAGVAEATQTSADLGGCVALADSLLVGIANLPLLSRQEYVQALRTRLAQVEARVAAVEEAQQAQAPLAMPAREVFSYSLSFLKAERSWLASRVQVPR